MNYNNNGESKFQPTQLELLPNSQQNNNQEKIDINTELLKEIQNLRQEVAQLRHQTRPINEKITSNVQENVGKLKSWTGGQLKSAWAGLNKFKNTIVQTVDAFDSKNISYSDPILKKFIFQESKLLKGRENYDLDLEDMTNEITELKESINQTRNTIEKLKSADFNQIAELNKDLAGLSVVSENILKLRQEGRYDEADKAELELNDKKTTAINREAKRNYKLLNKYTKQLLKTEAEKLNFENTGKEYIHNDYLDSKLTYLRGLEDKLRLKDNNYLGSEEYLKSPLKSVLDDYAEYEIIPRNQTIIKDNNIKPELGKEEFDQKPNLSNLTASEVHELKNSDVDPSIYVEMFGKSESQNVEPVKLEKVNTPNIDSFGFDYDKISQEYHDIQDFNILKPGQSLDLATYRGDLKLDFGKYKIDLVNLDGKFDDKINSKYDIDYKVEQIDKKTETAVIIIKGKNGAPDVKMTMDRNNKITALKVDKKLWSRDSQEVKIIKSA